MKVGSPAEREGMKRPPSIDKIMKDGRLIGAALRQAMRQALRHHKRACVPIAVWRNGKTIEIPPSRISVATTSLIPQRVP